jgi:hypothetical protein
MADFPQSDEVPLPPSAAEEPAAPPADKKDKSEKGKSDKTKAASKPAGEAKQSIAEATAAKGGFVSSANHTLCVVVIFLFLKHTLIFCSFTIYLKPIYWGLF